MNTIETIRAEIERLREAQLDKNGNSKDLFCSIRLWAYADLLSFLDTLEEPVSENLEEEIDACWQNWLSPSNQKEVEGVLPKIEFAMYARHFAVWGAEHYRESMKMISDDLEEAAENIYKVPFGTRAEDFKAGAAWQARQLLQGSPMPEDTILFNKGVEEGKRLMMEGAVEGKVFMSFAPGHNQMVMADVDLPTNTKVKVIIVKEE